MRLQSLCPPSPGGGFFWQPLQQPGRSFPTRAPWAQHHGAVWQSRAWTTGVPATSQRLPPRLWQRRPTRRRWCPLIELLAESTARYPHDCARLAGRGRPPAASAADNRWPGWPGWPGWTPSVGGRTVAAGTGHGVRFVRLEVSPRLARKDSGTARVCVSWAGTARRRLPVCCWLSHR